MVGRVLYDAQSLTTLKLPPSTSMIATDTASQKVSSWNRQTYQRLKLALTLGLRRQLFIAVCDDLSLRNRLAGKLHNELGNKIDPATQAQDCPRLVSLNLNAKDPNPFAQIAQWLSQNPHSRSFAPGFQILGIEQLTRQPPASQRLFLRRLQAIEPNLTQLESSLLLWLPRPWFYTIQQSVPEFWQWHTGIFEFEGEPTPLPPVGAKPEASSTAPPNNSRSDTFRQNLHILAQDSVNQPKPVDPKSVPEPPKPAETQNHQPAKDAIPTSSFKQALADLKEEHQDVEDIDFEQLINNPQYQLPELPELPIGESEQTKPSPPSADASPAKPPASPADAYLDLGNHYRRLIEQGEVTEENLEVAVQSYEQALLWLDNPAQVSDILNDVGNLYWMLSHCPGSNEHKLAYLEKGIQAYQLALTKITDSEAPQAYGMVQNNLGAAYGDLARYQEPAHNLELSIRAYEEALLHRRAETEPTKYASTQNNLGTAHWNLAQHQSPVENLRASIASYSEALSYYDSKTESMSWAMIQNNLGTAYWNLAQYEQAEHWLEFAIAAYQDSLIYRTAEAVPASCAATQNNLGTAYWHLADRFPDDAGARGNNLSQCIGAYEKAIALVRQLALTIPPTPVNFDILATHNNLGLAHYQLATEPQFALNKTAKSAHLEAALNQHLIACQCLSRDSDAYQTTVNYIVKTIRAFYQECGISGQNLALSKVPGQMLPAILPKL
jgi:tetratricopeptide (TPR) repeat protein